MKSSKILIVITILLLLPANILFTPPLSANDNGFGSYEFLPGPNYTQNDIKALFKISSDSSGLPIHNVTWKDPVGNTVLCTLGGGGCTTYPEYSANGYLITNTWEFFISGQQRSSGTYTAVVTYCTYSINPKVCLGWAEAFRADFYISDPTAFTISGNVGAAGVVLSYMDGSPKTVTANGIGDYILIVPRGWSGAVTPSKADHIFSPTSKAYTNILKNQTMQNYTAKAMNNRIYLPLGIR